MKLFKKLPFLCILLCITSFSQNIKITYTYKPSDLADYEENVFTSNNHKISIVDSIPVKKYKANYGDAIVVEKDKGIKPYRRILIDDIKNNTISFTYLMKKTNYLVSDNPPAIIWNLKYKETKKIGKYTCKKATATFRGTEIEAYYTSEIPVSIGPYKFNGLPGLILELKTLGTNKSFWTAKNIQYPYKGAPNYSTKYIKSLPKITLKDLVKKIDDRNAEEQSMFLSKLKLPPGVSQPKITTEGNTRGMVENKFEWE